MFDEKSSIERTNAQKKRKEGTLIYKDLIYAYEFFEGKCPYSETPIDESDWHLEHIIPVKMGGTTDSWNCIPVCAPCNLSKGSEHLLDWWDKNHKIEEEYKLEKIFLYLIDVLNKDRSIRITTPEEERKIKILEQQEIDVETDLPISDDYIEITKELDTFTFMYQLINHLVGSKQITDDKLQDYIKLLNDCYSKNKEFKRLDIELYKLQANFTKLLKENGVTNHYKISFEYSDRIDSLDIVAKNIGNIADYLGNIDVGIIINKNPEILFMSLEKFKHNFEYLINDVGISRDIVLKKPNLLNEIEVVKEFYGLCLKVDFDIAGMTNSSFDRGSIKNFIEILKSEEFKNYPHLFTSTTLAHSTPERIKDIIASEEFKTYPHLFTSTTLAHSTVDKIKDIIASEEFKNYPHLFTSTTLAHSTADKIKDIIASEEFKNYPHLFTSTTLAKSTPDKIKDIIASEEFKNYPHLFTSEVLARSTPERIKDMIASEEFKNYPHLFTSTTLAHSTPERIKDIIASEEFKNYPHLFTSTTLAHSTPENIREIIASEEFKTYPHLFTSTTLSQSTPDKIKDIIASEEFKNYPHLFTSTTLAKSTPERIKEVLSMEEWLDDKYSHLLKSCILSIPKERLRYNIQVAEQYGFENFITINYLIKSPSQNNALISYLIDNDIPIVQEEKLNFVFAYQPGALLKKYGIDIKQLIKMYPIEERGEKGAIR